MRVCTAAASQHRQSPRQKRKRIRDIQKCHLLCFYFAWKLSWKMRIRRSKSLRFPNNTKIGSLLQLIEGKRINFTGVAKRAYCPRVPGGPAPRPITWPAFIKCKWTAAVCQCFQKFSASWGLAAEGGGGLRRGPEAGPSAALWIIRAHATPLSPNFAPCAVLNYPGLVRARWPFDIGQPRPPRPLGRLCENAFAGDRIDRGATTGPVPPAVRNFVVDKTFAKYFTIKCLYFEKRKKKQEVLLTAG